MSEKEKSEQSDPVVKDRGGKGGVCEGVALGVYCGIRCSWCGIT